ncbi:hypothetical protein [Rhodococcoides kyotonense]|uniref:Uncharacterized protein n=1 Tax=Rhodococcoides kyotonense TaxID=398843 RepID=A0A239E4J0_9NOCA|nr:hypothetical protein [Rhodococcus kyotonensis]SNS38903.1 hypothetical protein SAMN05421642_102169 [Rhodococcus kyotonensis]
MNEVAESASRATTVAIIRRKVLIELKRRGAHATKVDELTLRLDSGGYLGLNNLVDRCLNAPVWHWGDCVEAHVTTMLESQRLSDLDRLMALPDEEFYMRLRERVAPLGNLPKPEAFTYSHPLVDAPNSPRRVLNLTFPDLALTVNDQLLENRDIDAAWAFGRENTAAMVFDDHESLIKDDIAIDVWRGDSIYLASKVADMPTLIAGHLGDAPFGVLFAIPSAYEIDYFLPREYDHTVRAAELMAGLAPMLARNTPNPLSTELYFWRDAEYCQVTGGSSAELFAQTLAELPS